MANSLLESSLAGMFYYPDWVQSTPPVFLLLARAAVNFFGLSNPSFRIVPLGFAMTGIVLMFAAARRLVSLPFATLACTITAFHPTAIDYSRTLKQYSGELAVSAAVLLMTVRYLKKPGGRRLGWLIGVLLLSLPLAWATVFLAPGVAVVVWANGGWRRAGVLTAAFGAVLGILYLLFIHENISPQLRAFWRATAQKPTHGLIAALVFCVLAALRVMPKLWKRRDARTWIQVSCLTPCFLLAAARLLHLYPADPRTRLFVLPCFLLAAAINAEDLFNWLMRVVPRRQIVARFAEAGLWLAAIAVGCSAVSAQLRGKMNQPTEDFEGAVRILKQEVSPADLLVVHASVNQGFKLYARMEGWNEYHALYGDTGWPCCARNKAAPGNTAASMRAAVEDLDRMTPPGFSGRVWLFYSARHTHWLYIGYDEPIVWSSRLQDRGCTPGPYYLLYNVAISARDCARLR